MKEQKEACLICGAELEYFTEAREQNCAICGDRKVTNERMLQKRAFCL